MNDPHVFGFVFVGRPARTYLPLPYLYYAGRGACWTGLVELRATWSKPWVYHCEAGRVREQQWYTRISDRNSVCVFVSLRPVQQDQSPEIGLGTYRGCRHDGWSGAGWSLAVWAPSFHLPGVQRRTGTGTQAAA